MAEQPAEGEPRFWLVKSEPETYSIDDLKRDKSTRWEGVRNYQARNYLKSMKMGDRALFYHSNADPPGVAGICTVSREAYPDPTAFDPESKYYDPKSSPENPRWFLVEMKFVRKLKKFIPLGQLKAMPGLEKMVVTQKGSRLSVQPVTAQEWETLVL